MSAFTSTQVRDGFLWTLGQWFCLVDAARNAEALEGQSDAEIKDLLTRDADCGGVLDCSDEAVLIEAGIVEPAPEVDYDDAASWSAEFFHANSGVLQN